MFRTMSKTSFCIFNVNGKIRGENNGGTSTELCQLLCQYHPHFTEKLVAFHCCFLKVLTARKYRLEVFYISLVIACYFLLW